MSRLVNKHSILVDVPLAAGLPADTVVPAGALWKLEVALLLVTTTATVGSRVPAIEIRDPLDVLVARFGSGTAQIASLTRNYSFGSSFFGSVDNTDVVIPMPIMVLETGWVIRVTDISAVDLAADSSRTVFSISQERV